MVLVRMLLGAPKELQSREFGPFKGPYPQFAQEKAFGPGVIKQRNLSGTGESWEEKNPRCCPSGRSQPWIQRQRGLATDGCVAESKGRRATGGILEPYEEPNLEYKACKNYER